MDKVLFYKALAELEKEGILIRGDKDKWKLTEKGGMEKEKMMILFSSKTKK